MAYRATVKPTTATALNQQNTMKTKLAPVVIHSADSLPYSPRIERLDRPPARPRFRTVYGNEVNTFTDDLAAFEDHEANMRHAAECAGLLETP